VCVCVFIVQSCHSSSFRPKFCRHRYFGGRRYNALFLLNGKMSRCAVRRSPASVSGSYDCADLGGGGEGYEKILAAALFLDAIALTNDEPAFSVSYFCDVCACLSC